MHYNFHSHWIYVRRIRHYVSRKFIVAKDLCLKFTLVNRCRLLIIKFWGVSYNKQNIPYLSLKHPLNYYRIIILGGINTLFWMKAHLNRTLGSDFEVFGRS